MECVYSPELRNAWESTTLAWVPVHGGLPSIHGAGGPPSGREGEGTASPDSSIATSTGIRSEGCGSLSSFAQLLAQQPALGGQLTDIS